MEKIIKKENKDLPHLTMENMCCACEYDIACMNEKIKEVEQRKVEEIRKEIKSLTTEEQPPFIKDDKFRRQSELINEHFLPSIKKLILNLKSLTNKE